MALSYKARRRLSLLILAVGMPLYVVVAVSVVNLFDRPSVWLELAIYGGLGVLWVLPFRSVFRGIGQADPEAATPDSGDPDLGHPDATNPDETPAIMAVANPARSDAALPERQG